MRLLLWKYKKLYFLFVCIIALFVFLFYHCFAIIYTNDKYTKKLEFDSNLGLAKYISIDDNFIYKYKSATFWDDNCFATVCNSEDQYLYIDQNGQFYTSGMQITFYIWPLLDKYGLDFYMVDGGKEINEQFYVDKNCNLITDGMSVEAIMYAEELINNNKTEITILREKANYKWHIW